MSAPLKRLVLDHRRLEQVFSVLEAEIDAWHEGRAPDSILINDCINYCLNYCDFAHHVREDLIFAQMLERDREGTTQVIESLEASHAYLAGITQKLQQTTNSALRSAEGDRDELKRLTEEFISRYRSHMAMEEEKLFHWQIAFLSKRTGRMLKSKILHEQTRCSVSVSTRVMQSFMRASSNPTAPCR